MNIQSVNIPAPQPPAPKPGGQPFALGGGFDQLVLAAAGEPHDEAADSPVPKDDGTAETAAAQPVDALAGLFVPPAPPAQPVAPDAGASEPSAISGPSPTPGAEPFRPAAQPRVALGVATETSLALQGADPAAPDAPAASSGFEPAKPVRQAFIHTAEAAKTSAVAPEPLSPPATATRLGGVSSSVAAPVETAPQPSNQTLAGQKAPIGSQAAAAEPEVAASTAGPLNAASSAREQVQDVRSTEPARLTLPVQPSVSLKTPVVATTIALDAKSAGAKAADAKVASSAGAEHFEPAEKPFAQQPTVQVAATPKASIAKAANVAPSAAPPVASLRIASDTPPPVPVSLAASPPAPKAPVAPAAALALQYAEPTITAAGPWANVRPIDDAEASPARPLAAIKTPAAAPGAQDARPVAAGAASPEAIQPAPIAQAPLIQTLVGLKTPILTVAATPEAQGAVSATVGAAPTSVVKPATSAKSPSISSPAGVKPAILTMAAALEAQADGVASASPTSGVNGAARLSAALAEGAPARRSGADQAPAAPSQPQGAGAAQGVTPAQGLAPVVGAPQLETPAQPAAVPDGPVLAQPISAASAKPGGKSGDAKPADAAAKTKAAADAALTHQTDQQSEGGATEPHADAGRAVAKPDAVSPQPQTAAAPATPSAQAAQPAAPTIAAGAQVAAAVQVANQIASHAGQRRTRFEVRLDPGDLGRVDVRLDFAQDGRVATRLIVEKPETLDLLRNDARELSRTLEQAGFQLGQGGLAFQLKDGRQAFWTNDAPASSGAPSEDIVEEAAPAAAVYARSASGAAGGVDRTV